MAGVVPSVRARLHAMRRDLEMLVRGLRGEVPPPFQRGRGGPPADRTSVRGGTGTSAHPPAAGTAASGPATTAAAPAASARAAASVAEALAPPSLLAPRTLRIAAVVRETADAVSLVLDDPTGAPIAFAAGQFFTLLVPLGGEVLRRAYSASSAAPGPGRAGAASVAITVKRIAGGRVSGHLVEHAAVGQLLPVLGPSGSFTLDPRADAVVLIGGGSGITPLMGFLRTLAAALRRGEAAPGRLVLVYGNRRREDVIFGADLQALGPALGERLVVRHVLEEPPPGWSGGTGRLDEELVLRELQTLGLPGFAWADAAFYVCGPEGMLVGARAALGRLGVAPAQLHEERFTSPHLRAAPASGPAALAGAEVVIRVGGREIVARPAPGQSVLEAGLAAGAPMPYSCALGGCGACKVRVLTGAVTMEEPNCLTAAERDAGFVLTCVGQARGAVLVEVPG